jgi:glycine/D-amino acid oxidase-like deaminating enzyme
MDQASGHYDAVVIGGGFYGCAIAVELGRRNLQVKLLESGPDLMQRASFANQARIHQGYHYPRSILTGLRSRINFGRFIEEYSDCVHSGFSHYYAIARIGSKVSAQQFRSFCERIDAPLKPAPGHIKALFSPGMIEDVFQVREYAFDARVLKDIMLQSLEDAGIDVSLNCTAERVSRQGDRMRLEVSGADGEAELVAEHVFNCTYSQINRVLTSSGLPVIPLKHEFTEMALIEMPDEMRDTGFTVMDGPFFSIIPFPPKGLHTLSHVRYTPHRYWQDREGAPLQDTESCFGQGKMDSRHIHMIKDAQRYIPDLAKCVYRESLLEIKTVLPQSETDDSRPILYRRSNELPNLISVMGGKIDNIFDIREKLGETIAASKASQ